MKKKIAAALVLFGVLFSGPVTPQSDVTGFPVKREETRETWKRGGEEMLARNRRLRFKRKKAKNVILFIGDGMGISTLTASRILEGQLRGESGEENYLSFERFPFTALSKTYSTNQQVSDSAPTASALLTGVKTDEGIISVDQDVVHGDYATVAGNEALTLLELAEMSGRSTGVVSTARITHATPAACYAHSPDRNWESDANIRRASANAYKSGFPDIARQLIEFPYGNGLEVALGGGRKSFLPEGTRDPEYPSAKRNNPNRVDGRDLTSEWRAVRSGSKYVWNLEQFRSIDPRSAERLLGLFEPSHMLYEFDRKKGTPAEPSLSEMTEMAIKILAKNRKGFFLMVEGGRIDHAHHEGNAFRALTDTIEFSNAVRKAVSMVDLKKTLIIVTADHSHGMTISGYPARGNNILGLTRELDRSGMRKKDPARDRDGKAMTTLTYANGPGYVAGARPNLDQRTVTGSGYKQEALVNLSSDRHTGEDVVIFGSGVNAWMIHGVMEQNWVFYVMRDALRLDEKKLTRRSRAKR